MTWLRILRGLIPQPRAGGSRFAVGGVAVAAVALLNGGTAWGLAGHTAPAVSGPSPSTQLTVDTNAGCNTTTPKPGFARCLSVVRTPSNHQITPNASAPPAAALGPADIQSAYKLPSSGGQTVAIVDAYGDSHAEADLAVFRTYYNLPPCTTANGCFKKVDQRGGTAYPADDTNPNSWPLETALDLDAVSAACPACNILLVEADDPYLDNLGAAVNEAVALGAKFISNSYGLRNPGEDPSETSFDHYYDHPGTVVTVSSGDVGNQVSWPSSSGKVVSVGGTRLTRDTTSTRGWTEAAWASGGSGCSQYEPKPDFQLAVTTLCANRATADISADADPASGLATYNTLGSSGWLQVGGTSLSSPLLAAMYALAGTPAANTYPNAYPYHDVKQSSDLNDITTGSNGSCGNLLCNAGPGWDGPTGLGTPNGVGALAGGPHGDIAGQVTNATTGKPVAGVTVTATPGGYLTRTDANGAYDIKASTGSYTLTASAYAYQQATQSGIPVGDGQKTTADFALTALPLATVTGTVTDGSGHGWPLYARISIDGYPGGPVYTNPATGAYSVVLAAPATYAAHITPAYPTLIDPPGNVGYQQLDTQLTVGIGGVTKDFALKADLTACTAPGYGWNGLSENFDTFTGTRPGNGWTVSGSNPGWRFDNPGRRAAAGAGNDRFAVADSGAADRRIDSTLTSPSVDLTGQSAPHLYFDSAYYAAPDQAAEIQLSTDGGKRWSTVWHQDSANAIGPIDVPLPQAANARDARIRFQYTGHGGWWWSVDDVLIGTHTCTARPGGLVVGNVTDHATGKPVNGATIAGSGVSGISTTTEDPNLPGGLYYLFTPRTGGQTFTASSAGYTTGSANVTVAPEQVTRQDWSLSPAGGN